jgi:hypothetical protein
MHYKASTFENIQRYMRDVILPGKEQARKTASQLPYEEKWAAVKRMQTFVDAVKV